jgi:heme A synthase
VHQRAFQSAIENGGPFTADTTMLLVHIVLGSLVSVLAGFLAALVAGEHTRAPRVLGLLLVALGVLKMVMSWPYVPIWYHVLFTALLFPMTMVGGRRSTRMS